MIIFLAASALSVSACLVDSNCVSDSDCPGDEQCNVVSGGCFLECTAGDSESCPVERPICLGEEHRCVECVNSQDCDDSEECVDSTCLPGRAPAFALVDANPDSATFGDEVALEDFQGDVVLLYFAGLG